MNRPFIVEEITKSWQSGVSQDGQQALSTLFEETIHQYWEAGYRLCMFQANSTLYGRRHQQTIIAVFERIDHAA